MTDQPYTQADLMAEAARQHYSLTDDAEYGCVGESIVDRGIGDTSETWGGLPRPDYEAAQAAIHDLIIHAADLSPWAVAIGADGLEPDPDALVREHAGRPSVRVHVAFAPDVLPVAREDVMRALSDALLDSL
ncbi:hypothetical protein [Embleya sp. NPDC005971]|uniref:hypothetical protein n=1 Tax=Embleya sp. NPDC005971 TaxID=3156724 RepID=UPI0033E0CBB1